MCTCQRVFNVMRSKCDKNQTQQGSENSTSTICHVGRLDTQWHVCSLSCYVHNCCMETHCICVLSDQLMLLSKGGPVRVCGIVTRYIVTALSDIRIAQLCFLLVGVRAFLVYNQRVHSVQMQPAVWCPCEGSVVSECMLQILPVLSLILKCAMPLFHVLTAYVVNDQARRCQHRCVVQ